MRSYRYNRISTYIFGEFLLDEGEQVLRRKNREIFLRPKAFDTLLFVVERYRDTTPLSAHFAQPLTHNDGAFSRSNNRGDYFLIQFHSKAWALRGIKITGFVSHRIFGQVIL
jgi:hypothetical protein